MSPWGKLLLQGLNCLIKLPRVPCHIVHLSSAEALPIILDARKQGAPITVETCHHYLSLDAETVPSGATQFKCCPPIREKENQVRLRTTAPPSPSRVSIFVSSQVGKVVSFLALQLRLRWVFPLNNYLGCFFALLNRNFLPRLLSNGFLFSTLIKFTFQRVLGGFTTRINEMK